MLHQHLHDAAIQSVQSSSHVCVYNFTSPQDHKENNPNCPTMNTYSSFANLHRIPGLAEHFIEIDDDVVITQPLQPGWFFTPGSDPENKGGQIFKVNWATSFEEKDIYGKESIIMGENGEKFVTQIGTLSGGNGKNEEDKLVLLPKLIPKMLDGGAHLPKPFLRSFCARMEAEYADWFAFVSSHRKRFCFLEGERSVLNSEPGNENGGCYQEESAHAILWYTHIVGKRVVNLPEVGW